MDKSFHLIRTNPRLTTNYKIVVSTDNNLYLESFNSSKELNDDKYKHYLLSIDAVLEDILPKFYDGIPKNIAFMPRFNDDASIMHTSYSYQFDNMYYSGSNNIEDQWFKEEFEYFAPLYVVKNNIPTNFIIMRVDDPSIYVKSGNDYVLGSLNKDNFRSEIIDKWKCVTNFDMTTNTNFGKFIDLNINNNVRFSEFPYFFDIKKYNFSIWSGMDYNSGVYTQKEMYLDELLKYQKLHFELEDYITSGYQYNGIIYPYIFNFKFLFDDEPATPTQLNKYSMNRYYGFYVNQMEHVKTITTYLFKELKTNPKVYIKNNIILDSNTHRFTSPFKDKYVVNDWVIIDNELFEIRKQENDSYKIISTKIFNDTVPSDSILYSSDSHMVSIINNNISNFGNIDEYVKDGKNKNFYSDLYLIEIDGLYHVLKNNSVTDTNGNVTSNNYYIQTDYNINSNLKTLKYYKAGSDSKYSVTKDMTSKPFIYKIYRINFTDVKDFDFDRLNTKYADFDYEKSEYVDTLEKKLYATEYTDTSIPKRKKIYPIDIDGQYRTVNVSSEYIANDELFEIKPNGTMPMWDKNQSICKWGYIGSVSHCDYPYKINNLVDNSGIYNRTVNTEMIVANAVEKNLDYFYRVGNFYGASEFFINYRTFTYTISFIDDSIWTQTNHDYWSIDKINNTINVNNTSPSDSYLTYYEDIVEDEYYYVTFRLVNTTVSSDTKVGIVGIFDQDFVIEDNALSYTFAATVKATATTKFKLYAKKSNAVFHNLEVIKVTSKYYLNQTTNIQTDFNTINTTSIDKKFNLDHYIKSDVDYFEFFFKNNMIYNKYDKEYTKLYTKYSMFNSGDSELPSVSLFKGIEYKISSVQEMVLEKITSSKYNIKNIITNGGSEFNGYKMSVILSETYDRYNFDKVLTTVVENDIIRNGYSAWDSNIVISTGDTMLTTINTDFLSEDISAWTSTKIPSDVANTTFVNNSDGKATFQIIGQPTSASNGGYPPSGVTGHMVQTNSIIDTGSNYVYDIEISIKWDITVNLSPVPHTYKLKIYSNSIVGHTINTLITMLNMTNYDIETKSGTRTYTFKNVQMTTDNQFLFDFSIINTLDSSPYNFSKHISSHVSIDSIKVNKKQYLPWTFPNDFVYIAKTPTNGIMTYVTGSNIDLYSVKTEFVNISTNKLINDTTYKYDVSFKFKWGITFNSSNSSEYYEAKFICNDFSTNVVNQKIFKKYGGTYTNTEGYSSTYHSYSGTVTYTLTNVTFDGATDNTLKIDTYIENTLSFASNLEAYVELVEVVINVDYPSLKYDNPTLDSTQNVTLTSGGTMGGSIYNDIISTDGIHVFVNKKHKNVLVIHNKKIAINKEWVSLNNIDFFGENYGLYYGKTLNDTYNLIPITGTTITDSDTYNPSELCAQYYIQGINNINSKGITNQYVTYYVIDEDGNFGKTKLVEFNTTTDSMDVINDNIYPPFILEVSEPTTLTVHKYTYNVTPIDGPLDFINDKYIVYHDNKPMSESIINEPLARSISKVVYYNNYNGVVHGENPMQTVDLKRYSGYYEPIFNDISLYDSNYIWNNAQKSFKGNYVFNTNLDQFGYINEIMYSKVNEDVNVLKLKQVENWKSSYPMIDEIGLSQTKRFIFQSSWDSNFYIRTLEDVDHLDLFKDPDDIVVKIPADGDLSDIIINNIPYYTNGVKLFPHGYPSTANTISYSFKITNTADDNFIFKYSIKYYSPFYNITVNMITLKSTSSIEPDESILITEVLNRPSAVNSGQSSYQEYTTWKVIIELYTFNNILIETNDALSFNIYNLLVNYSISSVSMPASQQCGNNYTFTVNVADSVQKLTNIPVTLQIMALSPTPVANYVAFDRPTTLLGTATQTLTVTSFIPFLGGLTMSSSQTIRYIFFLKNNFIADGVTQTILKAYNASGYPINTSRSYIGGTAYTRYFGSILTLQIFSTGNTLNNSAYAKVTHSFWNGGTSGSFAVTYALYDASTNLIISTTTKTIGVPANTTLSFTHDFITSTTGQPVSLLSTKYYFVKLSVSASVDVVYSNLIIGVS